MTALCGWKTANRWALTGDHFDAQEALRIGMVNEVVPHDQLMTAALTLARRIALVPEPSVRLNKAIAMQGIQAAGLYAALLLEGTLGTLAQASHNEFREQLFEVHRTQGVKAYLEMRDGPFQPEPMGPRSKKGRKSQGDLEDTAPQRAGSSRPSEERVSALMAPGLHTPQPIESTRSMGPCFRRDDPGWRHPDNRSNKQMAPETFRGHLPSSPVRNLDQQARCVR